VNLIPTGMEHSLQDVNLVAISS